MNQVATDISQIFKAHYFFRKVARNKDSNTMNKSMGFGDAMEINTSQIKLPPADVSLAKGRRQRRLQIMPKEGNGFTNSAQLHGNFQKPSFERLQMRTPLNNHHHTANTMYFVIPAH